MSGTTDLTTLVSALNAMTQVLGLNGKSLAGILNAGTVAASYIHIAGAGTFVAQGSSATLLSLNINTGASASTGTVYNASGTASIAGSLVVGIFNFGTASPLEVPIGPQGHGLRLNSGLVIVTTGSADITFGYL